ncbi:MAG: transglycosylase domain-containing protein, partial [Anaerolineaceae bacterium]|nr:transglycosylase domain-containing protein [Anaerolineaceae bacterium]
MDDQEKTPSNLPEEDPVSKTQPGKRMRRLLAGSETNDAIINQPPEQQLESSIEPDVSPTPASESPPETQTGNLAEEKPASEIHPDVELPAVPGEPEIAWKSELDETQVNPAQTNPIQPNRLTDQDSETQGLPAFPDNPTIPLASSGMENLPRRVEEIDPHATRVTPAAYQSRSIRRSSSRPGQVNPQPGPTRPSGGDYPPGSTTQANPIQRQGPGSQPPRQPQPTYRRSVGVGVPASTAVKTGRRNTGWRRSLGCILRVVIALLFMVIFIIVAAGSWLVFRYFTIARSLPPVAELRQRAAQFETTRIYDRNGGVLYEIIDPNAGRRTVIPLERISPYLVAATIATEDREYYNHPGFDPIAIARAFWYNYTTGEVVSGASTITQQLARMLLLSPEERNERTYERKAREIVLAAEITRNYSKDEILTLYLNEANYSNLAYGIEAASETYFGTTADKLTMGQATFLAGLPQSPGVYDIY